jgi:hypothetical protein
MREQYCHNYECGRHSTKTTVRVETHPAEALGCGRKLFYMMVAEDAARGLDDAPP